MKLKSFILQYQQAVATVPVGFTSASKYGMDYYLPITEKEHNAAHRGLRHGYVLSCFKPRCRFAQTHRSFQNIGHKTATCRMFSKKGQFISMLNWENLAPGHSISSLNWSICRWCSNYNNWQIMNWIKHLN